jgi:hypothetical protein
MLCIAGGILIWPIGLARLGGAAQGDDAFSGAIVSDSSLMLKIWLSRVGNSIFM